MWPTVQTQRFNPSDLVFDLTISSFKLVHDIIDAGKHSDYVSLVSDQNCGLFVLKFKLLTLGPVLTLRASYEQTW